MKNKFLVKDVSFNVAKEWFLHKHYAKRIPNRKKIFGLFRFNSSDLIGVCCFGTAPSSFWNNGGTLFKNKIFIEVFELNRLVVDCDVKNISSWFVSQCIKKLPKECVIVSYADIDMNHTGFIYQACNFNYYGVSKPMCKSKTYFYNGKEYHGRTMTSSKIKQLLGDRFDSKLDIETNFLKIGSIKRHTGKHRYIFFKSSNKRKFEEAIVLDKQKYPKEESKRYFVDMRTEKQAILF